LAASAQPSFLLSARITRRTPDYELQEEHVPKIRYIKEDSFDSSISFSPLDPPLSR